MSQLSHAPLRRQALTRMGGGLLLLGGLFFGTAGTFHYWEAWLYLAVLFLPMGWLVRRLIARSPELLERRLRFKEKERVQVGIAVLNTVLAVATFALPGLDHRFGWSRVPTGLALLADLCVLLGYGIFARVMLENPYASRIVEVEPGQRLVDTGPYAVVRHPMYVGALLMYLASPPALGSWWALLAAVPLPVLLVARIRNEEAVLLRDLPGYREYTARVRHRLIPGLW